MQQQQNLDLVPFWPAIISSRASTPYDLSLPRSHHNYLSQRSQVKCGMLLHQCPAEPGANHGKKSSMPSVGQLQQAACLDRPSGAPNSGRHGTWPLPLAPLHATKGPITLRRHVGQPLPFVCKQLQAGCSFMNPLAHAEFLLH